MKSPGLGPKEGYYKDEKEEKRNLPKFIFGVFLFIVSLLTLGAIFYNLATADWSFLTNEKPNYQELYEEKLQNETYQEYFINGSIYGYNLAHLEIFNEVSKCGRFPVTIQNISYNLIAEECLEVER